MSQKLKEKAWPLLASLIVLGTVGFIHYDGIESLETSLSQHLGH